MDARDVNEKKVMLGCVFEIYRILHYIYEMNMRSMYMIDFEKKCS